jgi:LPXTG-site transpeptidase (sortase) family protein
VSRRYIIGNKYKKYSRVLPIIILGSAAALLFTFTASYYARPTTQPVDQTEQKVVAQVPLPQAPIYGLPIHLEIPKIKVSTDILQMGLTVNGDMDAPAKVTDVGWYKNGPHPGNVGNAVIAGHFGVGGPGVFVDLDKLQKDDHVLVTDEKGQTSSFVVRETRTYGYTEHPSEVFNTSGGAHLNLITCAGTWNAAARTYNKRLVIFADKST